MLGRFRCIRVGYWVGAGVSGPSIGRHFCVGSLTVTLDPCPPLTSRAFPDQSDRTRLPAGYLGGQMVNTGRRGGDGAEDTPPSPGSAPAALDPASAAPPGALRRLHASLSRRLAGWLGSEWLRPAAHAPLARRGLCCGLLRAHGGGGAQGPAAASAVTPGEGGGGGDGGGGGGASSGVVQL